MKFMPGPLTIAELMLYVPAVQPLMVQTLVLLFHVAVQPVSSRPFLSSSETNRG